MTIIFVGLLVLISIAFVLWGLSLLLEGMFPDGLVIIGIGILGLVWAARAGWSIIKMNRHNG